MCKNNRWCGLRFWCIASVCCYAYENQINILSEFSFGLCGLTWLIHLINSFV
jgi:hypothetical protein